MPALVPFANVVKIEFEWLMSTSHTASCRFYYQFSGAAPTAANLNALATAVSVAYGDTLTTSCNPNVVLTDIEITDLTSAMSAIGSWSGTVPGTSTGDQLPIDTSVCMNSKISRRYRGGRPKLFLPFGVTQALGDDDDTWTEGFLDQINAGWVSFKTALQAISGVGITLTQHVNCSFYEGFSPSMNPISGRWRNIPKPRTTANAIPPDPISLTTAAKTISVQRRRRFTPS